MLTDNFHSWGNSSNRIAEVLYDASPDPKSYNSTYLKGQRRIKTPIPKPGQRSLPSKKSAEWDADNTGVVSAKASLEPLKTDYFNSTYLKPNPKTQFKVPVPTPYSIEKTLEVFQEDKFSNEETEEKE